jgi:hypothetical protein
MNYIAVNCCINNTLIDVNVDVKVILTSMYYIISFNIVNRELKYYY